MTRKVSEELTVYLTLCKGGESGELQQAEDDPGDVQQQEHADYGHGNMSLGDKCIIKLCKNCAKLSSS